MQKIKTKTYFNIQRIYVNKSKYFDEWCLNQFREKNFLYDIIIF